MPIVQLSGNATADCPAHCGFIGSVGNSVGRSPCASPAPGSQPGAGEAQGDLPTLLPTDPMNPQWAGQSAVAFPDNWTIGIDFYHTIFAREHNAFVAAFRARTRATPDADSGLRNPC